MIRRFVLLGLLAIVAASASSSVRLTKPSSQEPCAQDRHAWVADALKKMETIKPGMTRARLLKVFTTEGGTSTPLHRTFVSQDCPYFKVDVTFKAVDRSSDDNEGQAGPDEDSRDIIVKISQPYLQFSIVD
ncbi:MAG: hypothetical protein WAN14_05325 [Candidatus Acidiferrales bacterium]